MRSYFPAGILVIQQMPQVQESAIAPPRGLRAALASAGGSVHKHPAIWTCSLLAAGLLVRIWHASGTFLNSDEAIQFAIANKVSWWETYRANLSINAHPPCWFSCAAWRHLGDSELSCACRRLWLALHSLVTFKRLGLLEERRRGAHSVAFLVSVAGCRQRSALRNSFFASVGILLERALSGVLHSNVGIWNVYGYYLLAFFSILIRRQSGMIR